jgi:hypothetical protein
MLKMIGNFVSVFMLVCMLLINPAWSPALVLNVTTSKPVYNAGETLEIRGNLTNNGTLVPDGLVLLQINNPKGNPWTVRTLTTGEPPSGPFPVEVLNVTSTDSSGQPKSLFNPGQDAGFKVYIRNNALLPYHVLALINLYYSNGVPFKLFKIYNATIDADTTISASTYPVHIPSVLEGVVYGKASAYASVSDDFPNRTGFAYGPEANGTFNIVNGGGGSTPPASPPGTFNFTIPLKSIWLGNYSIYANVRYGFQTSLSTNMFTVILIGDLNGDGKIDIKDISIVAKAYGSDPSKPNWNPIADLNHDDKVDIKDVAIVAKVFGVVTLP